MILPAPGVRIVEVAVKDIARDFIIETNIVIAHHAGIGHGEQIVNAASERGLVIALCACFLWGDAGNEHCFRLRQIVVCGFTVKDLGLPNDIKIVIGTNGGKLRRAIQRRAGAEGFVIVEEESGGVGRFLHGQNVIPDKRAGELTPW